MQGTTRDSRNHVYARSLPVHVIYSDDWVSQGESAILISVQEGVHTPSKQPISQMVPPSETSPTGLIVSVTGSQLGQFTRSFQ